MDYQVLVVRLIQHFVLLTIAVEVAQRWRELAEKLASLPWGLLASAFQVFYIGFWERGQWQVSWMETGQGAVKQT